MRTKKTSVLAFLLSICLALSSCDFNQTPTQPDGIPPFDESRAYEEDGAYAVINNNVPNFTDEEKSTLTSFESYSELDALGRCGVALACVGLDIMPTEDREDLYVEPSGWVQKNYDGLYLYNRCHLIGFQLTGENNNVKNLITGTDYMNKTGMLPFENLIDDYIEETGNHVMYRVTPIYEGEYDLVAKGVLMEAYSVEDEGDGICFNVFCYNVQPGIVINYYDGTSRKAIDSEAPDVSEDKNENAEGAYVLNINSKVIHKQSCSHASKISDKNRREFNGILVKRKNDKGITVVVIDTVEYKGCGVCKPFN